jgi:beta-N-acetylhexosaminidase
MILSYDPEEGAKLSHRIAMEGCIIHQDTNKVLPINIKEKSSVCSIFGNPARLVMSDATNLYDPVSTKKTIENRTKLTDVKEYIMPWITSHMEKVSLCDLGYGMDVCIFSTVNAFNYKEQIEVLKMFKRIHKDVLVIGVASRSREDVNILKEHCDVVVSTGGLTQPSLDALVDIIFK